jgi:hypothetical protein
MINLYLPPPLPSPHDHSVTEMIVMMSLAWSKKAARLFLLHLPRATIATLQRQVNWQQPQACWMNRWGGFSRGRSKWRWTDAVQETNVSSIGEFVRIEQRAWLARSLHSRSYFCTTVHAQLSLRFHCINAKVDCVAIS